jgi:integrase
MKIKPRVASRPAQEVAPSPLTVGPSPIALGPWPSLPVPGHPAWRLLRCLAAKAVPAKAESLHPHDLRHAFVTLSLDAGASLRDVQDAAGHANLRTTRRYDRARYNLDKHPTYALAGPI